MINIDKKNKMQEQPPDFLEDNASFLNFMGTLTSSQETRGIYLFGEVNEGSILMLISQIHTLIERDDKEDIMLYINSDGGNVQDCLALIDVMNAAPCDISTCAIGRAASAACLIASNGTPGKRYGGRNAEFMFHELYGDVIDLKYSEIPYYRELFKRQTKTVNRIFSRNTGKTMKDVKALFMNNNLDKWITSVEAQKFGIIDRILPSRRRSK